MISAAAVRVEAAKYQAEDPDCGPWSALKLAAVRAIMHDDTLSPDTAMAQVRQVFEAQGWGINHVIARLSGAL